MKNKTKFQFAVLILILVSLACGGNSVPAMSTQTSVPNTSTPLPTITMLPSPVFTFAPLAFTIQAPLASPTATATLPPTSDADVSFARQIYFVAGATSTSVIGGVNPNQILTYSLYIVGNQPAQIALGSENNDATMAIYDPDRIEILSPAAQATSWQGYFQKAGIYYINVRGNGATTSKFNLSTKVSARVIFADGTSDFKVRAATVGGSVISYALHAASGQTLEAALSTPPELAAFTIWGFTDGHIYARAAAGTTSFSMLLPATQDYIIDIVPQAGKVVTYVLKISLK